MISYCCYRYYYYYYYFEVVRTRTRTVAANIRTARFTTIANYSQPVASYYRSTST